MLNLKANMVVYYFNFINYKTYELLANIYSIQLDRIILLNIPGQ